MIYIANPLYDCAFYFMMEDESASKALLSALLLFFPLCYDRKCVI